MHVLLLNVSPSLAQELERRLQGEEAHAPHFQLLQATRLEELPAPLPPGLLVLADPGGPLDDILQLCRHLHARRSSATTHFILLTHRTSAELKALALAGVDECLVPPGEQWTVRLMALRRRLLLDGMETPAVALLERPRVEPQEALYVLLSSTSGGIGHDYFRALVAHLASAFRVSSVMVGALTADRAHLQSLALWRDGSLQEERTSPLRGTPHQQAIAHGSTYIPDELAARFPEDLSLQRLRLRAYLGLALRDSQLNPVGVLAVAHTEPFEAGILDYALLGAFAARAGAELARIRAQAELERTRDFLRNTLNAVPDPVFVKDRSHAFVAMNGAFARVMGRTEEQLTGKSDYDFVPAHEADFFWRMDEEVFRALQPRETEEVLTDGAGQTRILHTKKAPFTDASGELFLVGVVRDITESRRMEMQLLMADRMASVGMLAAGVAHEINNPLAYLSSNLSFIAEHLAQEEALTPEQRAELREAAQESLEGAGRVRNIVQDLKAFARADDETPGPVDVHRVIQGALRLVRNEFQHRAQLTRALEPVPAVRGNEARLGQVIVNLLVNALQALPSDRGAEHNRVHISTSAQGKWVFVEVEDNGHGMSAEVQQHIFDAFFTTKPKGVGTGLGLSISHSLIQAMGGRIEVQSVLGQGSTFRLVLPVFTQAPEVPEGEPEERAAPSQTPPEPRRRVLLIDDEPSVGSAMRRLLQGEHEIHAVQDAREALRLLAQGERYDAILCDVMMQGMSGVQFLQELERERPELARRTGFMTGGVFDAQARQFFEGRALECLQKPFDHERLKQFLERLCSVDVVPVRVEGEEHALEDRARADGGQEQPGAAGEPDAQREEGGPA